MKDFEISYDAENDDLFVYLKEEKSKGAIEVGNFIFDFDEKGSLVAMQIISASETLSKLLSKVIQISEIKDFKAEAVSIRNMASIRFTMDHGSEKEAATIMVPRIVEKSPALNY